VDEHIRLANRENVPLDIIVKGVLGRIAHEVRASKPTETVQMSHPQA
jgi:hypothetical protein